MAKFTNYVPEGVIPAILLPFAEDLSIDAPAFKSHLLDVASVEPGGPWREGQCLHGGGCTGAFP